MKKQGAERRATAPAKLRDALEERPELRGKRAFCSRLDSPGGASGNIAFTTTSLADGHVQILDKNIASRATSRPSHSNWG